MKLIERCAGNGDLTWRGESVGTVGYAIDRYQAMTAAGLPIPGLHRFEGRLELDGIAEPGRLAGGSVALKLEDGRTLNLTITDAAGNVLAEGHGPSKCMCC